MTTRAITCPVVTESAIYRQGRCTMANYKSVRRSKGRPLSKETIKNEVINRISNGESLLNICRDDKMPCRDTIFEWLSRDKEFSDKYDRAREIRADRIFDEILEIADDSSDDYVKGDEGEIVLNREAIERAKLKIDARKWILAKMVPKKYSEKMELEHSGSVTLPGFMFREKRPEDQQ